MKKTRYTWFFAAFSVVTSCFFLGFKAGDEHAFQIAKNLDVFSAIVKELDMLYVDSLDADKTIRTGIDAMLYSLDPYTAYYPEEDSSELEQMLKNSYGGIGSIITYDSKRKRTVISEPYEGMPAAQVGLRPGDFLLDIDGKDLYEMNTKKVSEMLRGEVGTKFRLRVERPGVKKPLSFDIVRRSIQLPFIPYYGKLDDGVGYIKLSTFSGNPSKEFKRAFLDLKQQGIRSLVIDLRDNGGGLLDESVEIANFFLPRGKTLVTTKGKLSQVGQTYKTLREPIDQQIPLAVLVNNSTASSSEILAGSLQDLDRAVIVGTRTYGKGLVQTTRALPYGANMKITTSKYYIPSGRCVQAIDYTHRNEDGSVGRIPDSLTTVFHTAAGREVRDGGGITPDVQVEPDKLPNILYYLVAGNYIFDYATQYCLNRSSIAPAEQFSISDSEYDDFKKYIAESDFKYNQQTEKMLKNLKEIAEFEGYLKDADSEFAALESKLKHNLNYDLDFSKKMIKEYLAEEIVKRYYFQKGVIIQQLKDDKELKEAVKILSDEEKYNSMLRPKAVE